MVDKTKIFELLDNLDCVNDALDELGYSKYAEYVSEAMSVICKIYGIDEKQYAALDNYEV